MSDMQLFHTRARANEGKRLPLFTPDGKPTEHWLQVRHVWSDAFQSANEAEVAALRETMLENPEDKTVVDEAKREAQIRIWAALVSGWSFEIEATPEAVAEFLRDAPQIGAQIDKFAADARRFFGDDSTSSNAGSGPSEA